MQPQTSKTQQNIPEDQPKQIKLQAKFLNKLNIPLDVQLNETLSEIKQYLSDNTILYFYNTFSFYSNDQKLNDNVEVQSFELEENQLIQIRLESFTEFTAKQHVKRINQIFSNPLFFKTICEGSKQFNTNNQKLFDFLPDLLPSDQLISPPVKEAKELSNEDQLFKMSMQSDFKNKFLLKSFKKNKIDFEQCYEYIIYSGYNPPSRQNQLRGDLFYLQLKSLENTIFYITASVKGFFINRSNNSYFDPSPNPQYTIHPNLLELMGQISKQFVAKFTLILNKIEQQQFDIPDFNSLESLQYLNFFFLQNFKKHELNYQRTENYLQNPYGYNPNGYKDWNTELNIFRDMPKDDIQMKLNREKNLFKCYNDFVMAAVNGAIATVEQNLTPLNPMDPQQLQVYVYNNIFFSFAHPNTYNFQSETEIDSTPTITTTNNDLRNFKILHKLNIKDLSLLHTVLVDYKGHRIVCQSIIPGILNNDQQQCIQYGSIDEGKTIQNHYEFETLMTFICKHFFLEEKLKFFDQNDKQHILSGSSEVKGIRGTDKRLYIIDLLRLSPRDLNYPDKEDSACVLRLELIDRFINFTCLKKVSKTMQNDDKIILEQDKNKQSLQEKMDQRMENFTNLMEKERILLDFRLNSNIGTQAPLVMQSPQFENGKKKLEELAKFLKEQVIQELIQEMQNEHENSKYMADQKSFVQLMHKLGINVRYLGAIYDELLKTKKSNCIQFLQRIILARCLKHVIREFMRESPSHLLQYVISHVLNCILSKNEVLDLLERGELKFEFQKIENTNQKTEDQQQKKKKKKKKNKSNSPENEESKQIEIIEIKSPSTTPFLNLKPSDIWNKIKKVAVSRYRYTYFPDKIQNLKLMEFGFCKLSLLRDICLSNGIVIECQFYDLKNDNKVNKITNYLEMVPFQANHILDIKPLVKSLEFVSDEAQVLTDLANNVITLGGIKDSFDMIFQSIQITQQIFGQYHKDIAQNLSKISHLYFELNDIPSVIIKKYLIQQAINYQKQALVVYLNMYGLLHYETACCYNALGVYNYKQKELKKAFKYFCKCMYIYSMVGGETLPDSFTIFSQMNPILKELDLPQLNISIMLQLLERSLLIYDEKHIQIAKSYHHLAIVHQDIQDFTKSVDYQQKCVEILRKNYTESTFANFLNTMENYLLQLQHKLENRKENTMQQQKNLRDRENSKKQNYQAKTQYQEESGKIPEEKTRVELLESLRLAKMQYQRGGLFRSTRHN